MYQKRTWKFPAPKQGQTRLEDLLKYFADKGFSRVELPPQQSLEDICANVEQSLKLLDTL